MQHKLKVPYSVPIDTSKFTGRQFVAGEDPLQTQAIGLAQAGVGAYQPFLSAAQAAQQQAAYNCWWTWCVNRSISLPTFYVSVSTTSY